MVKVLQNKFAAKSATPMTDMKNPPQKLQGIKNSSILALSRIYKSRASRSSIDDFRFNLKESCTMQASNSNANLVMQSNKQNQPSRYAVREYENMPFDFISDQSESDVVENGEEFLTEVQELKVLIDAIKRDKPALQRVADRVHDLISTWQHNCQLVLEIFETQKAQYRALSDEQ